MLQRMALVASATMLSAGCAGMNYVAEHYPSDVPRHEVRTAHDTFTVFDKPPEGRMIVIPSVGAAAMQGVSAGLLFNSAAAATPKPIYQEAAEAHLTNTGRKCQVKDGYVVLHPTWEFRYECSA
jgi:hypothetical protein